MLPFGFATEINRVHTWYKVGSLLGVTTADRWVPAESFVSITNISELVGQELSRYIYPHIGF